MFWVLRKKDDATVALTPSKEIAEWIVKTYVEECEVREEVSSSGLKKDRA